MLNTPDDPLLYDWDNYERVDFHDIITTQSVNPFERFLPFESTYLGMSEEAQLAMIEAKRSIRFVPVTTRRTTKTKNADGTTTTRTRKTTARMAKNKLASMTPAEMIALVKRITK